MSFRTYQAILVVAALMAGCLMALPVWDWWSHRQAGEVSSSFEAAEAPAEVRATVAAGITPPQVQTAGFAAPRVQPAAPGVQPPAPRIQPSVAESRQSARSSSAEAAARPSSAQALRPSETNGPTKVAGPSEGPAGRPPAPAQEGSLPVGGSRAAGSVPPPSTGGPLSWIRGLFVQSPPAGPATDSPPQPAESPAPAQEEDPSDPAPDPDRTTEGQAPRLSLVPSAASVAPGQVLSIRVVVTGGEKITSVPFHLKFDPTVLNFLGARTGSAFVSSSLQPLLLASVNPERPGDLAVGLALIGDSRSFTGSGSLVVLDFRAVGRGRSDLIFENSSVRGVTSEPLPAEFANTSIQID